jgi:regulator of protease activity HflC (stomatin/prohibitin superfamily)
MKTIKINTYQVGLVFKDGAYQRSLTEGKYRFWKNEVIEVYDITKPFVAPVELNILLQDEALAARLQVIAVKDNEIALQYENDLLKKVLTAGRYAYWKSVVNYRFVYADISQLTIAADIDQAVLQHALLASYVRSISVESYEKALLFVDGRYTRTLDSGVYRWWKNNITLQVVRVDLRRQQMEINGQEILTRDKAALRINAWAQYQVTDIERAVLQNKEYASQLYVALQLALREYVAGYGFDELLEKKDGIAAFVLEKVQDKAGALGIMLSGFGIRDIILPGDVREIMNQVLVAEKKAQANIIMRREETASTRSLLNTARLMEENAMLWKLKEMEYIEKIADRVNSISVNGNGLLLEQLKQLFITQK